MGRILHLGAALAAMLFLFGCAALTGIQQSTYLAQLRGEFDGNGEFAAAFYVHVNPDGSTFVGELRDFQFTRAGFNRPSGRVAVQGTLTRAEDGELLLQGQGEGTLTQGNREYLLEFEMESSSIDENFDTISGWFFGGGDFNRGGEYVDWPKLRGEFQARRICAPNPFSQTTCGIPAPAD